MNTPMILVQQWGIVGRETIAVCDDVPTARKCCEAATLLPNNAHHRSEHNDGYHAYVIVAVPRNVVCTALPDAIASLYDPKAYGRAGGRKQPEWVWIDTDPETQSQREYAQRLQQQNADRAAKDRTLEAALAAGRIYGEKVQRT
jgi:hypothetical protein